MYICIYVYMYICRNVNMYIYIHIHTCMYICIYVNMRTCKYVYRMKIRRRGRFQLDGQFSIVTAARGWFNTDRLVMQ